MIVHFAYDGSINGDWVARYAIHMASLSPQRRLHLIHVDDGSCATEHRTSKLTHLERECEMAGVRFEAAIAEPSGTVATTLATMVREQQDNLLLCGTRVRSRAKGFLRGTVSQELLRMRPCHVVAVRVVQPGLLGAPHRLLLPVAGHPRGFLSGVPLVRLLRRDIDRLHILRVMAVSQRSTVRQPRHRFQRLRQIGLEYVQRIERELIQKADVETGRIDTFVRISDDWAKQIVIHASHHKSQLICLGASERSLAHRLWFGSPLEYVLEHAPCDVAVYRGTG